ncbi:MAG: hypothetical protein E6J14_15695 [Chloroflexi bacterium]|nr:MAG: hypothetical protein E6J14_15695 [Chloroflexota bacterium]
MRLRTAPVIVAALLAVACGGSPTAAPTPTGTPGLAGRPASTASLQLTSPADNATVTGSVVHVMVSLSGAQVVAQTSTHIQPDRGHVHLYLDNQLIYMQYRLEQDVPVKRGTYALKAEFVAADHVPFNPRVWSQQIIFTVRAA